MTLLTEMLERPLDPGYAAAAQKRTAAGLEASTGTRAPWLIAVLVLIGATFGISAMHWAHAANTTKGRAKAALVSQIEGHRGTNERLASQAIGLRAEVISLEARGTSGVGKELARRLAELGVAAGGTALRGPAFVVTLDDAAEAKVKGQGTVVARDVQVVANALWQAGAEAISVNGIRLTSTSSIRFAGSAIVVDYRPLARPYVITAIGSPQTLPARFAEGPGGTYLATLRSTFGLLADTVRVDEATVPAARSLRVRTAVPLPTKGPS